ncbi:MAG: Flp pilus assembly complex ATPase component [Planctomycetes bacterium]|nr:Flp pilus assembly complex ATPase component [Planctomycetota bacterium]
MEQSEEIKLDQALVRLGFVTDEEVLKARGQEHSMQVVDLSSVRIGRDVLGLVSKEIAEKHKLLPLSQNNGVLTVAVADPLDLYTLDNLRFMLGAELKCALASREMIERGIANCYGGAAAENMAQEMKKIGEGEEVSEEDELEAMGMDAEGDDAPVVRLVHMILKEAVRARASDIHIEPLMDRVRVRYRVDGVCKEVQSPPKRLQGPIISRVKIMAGIDIAEKRRPQDGRIAITVGGKALDLRVSCLPANHGESVVLRLLEKESVMINLTDLGFDPQDYKRFERIIRRPNGIFLVTGPTGSGKTTSLYAALNDLNRPDVKIITAENPVEYHMTGVNQCHVQESIGLTFATILRAMLRQSPNIILVGEIRDPETAEIAIQAALTGHLVFSTLHTNDAPSAITRLTDMGVAPFLVSTSIQAVMAQRLVRRICNRCKQPITYDMRELAVLRLLPEQVQGITFYKGVGCADCNDTGYKGRSAIFEMMEMTNDLREMAFARATARKLRLQARRNGMATLEDDGARKILAGITTLEEVLSITQREEPLET